MSNRFASRDLESSSELIIEPVLGLDRHFILFGLELGAIGWWVFGIIHHHLAVRVSVDS